MAQRSLGSRLAVGSILWAVGLLLVAFLVALAVVHHSPRAAGSVHWAIIGFSAAILMAAGWAQFHRSLTPFDRLRARLQAVREGSTTQVDGEYPPEVQPLVDDLNTLLAHQAASVTRAQAKAGDLAHGLKTPLTVLSQEADRLAASGHSALAEAIRHQIGRMQRHVNYYLTQARAAASGATLNAHTPVRESVDGLVRVLDRVYADRRITLENEVDASDIARVHRVDLDEMLGNVLDNACKWAAHRVRVSSSRDGSHLVVLIDDDGPGVAAHQRESVLQRGVKADETAPGTGLGLAIVRDLAELYGGHITLEESPLGGLRVRVALPEAPHTHQAG